MECKCGKEMVPLKEESGTNYTVLWWCSRCGRVAFMFQYYENGIKESIRWLEPEHLVHRM